MNRGNVAALTVLLVSALVPACSSPPGDAVADDPSPSTPTNALQTLVPLPSGISVPPGHGSIQGLVKSIDNESVEKAFVAVMETGRSTRTDRLGSFDVPNLAVGTYTIHIDAETYNSTEVSVDVLADFITQVSVRLESIEPPGDRPHAHRLWGANRSVEIFHKSDIRFPWSLQGSLPEGDTRHAKCMAPASPLDGEAQDLSCTDIRLEADHPVWPGTEHLTISVGWVDDGSVASVEFLYQNAQNSSFGGTVVVENGQSHEIAVSREEADAGHARFTAWSYGLRVVGSAARVVEVQSGDLMKSQVFSVQITAFRGDEVLLEPAHPDYWAAANSVTLTKAPSHLFRQLKEARYVRDPKQTQDGPGLGLLLPSGVIVPNGTTRLEFDLQSSCTWPSVTSQVGSRMPALDLELRVRTAAASPREASLGALLRPEAKNEPTGQKFSLKIGSKDADEIGQKVSAWLFLITDSLHPDEAEFNNSCVTPVGIPVPSAPALWVSLSIEAFNDDLPAPSPAE